MEETFVERNALGAINVRGMKARAAFVREGILGVASVSCAGRSAPNHGFRKCTFALNATAQSAGFHRRVEPCTGDVTAGGHLHYAALRCSRNTWLFAYSEDVEAVANSHQFSCLLTSLATGHDSSTWFDSYITQKTILLTLNCHIPLL